MRPVPARLWSGSSVRSGEAWRAFIINSFVSAIHRFSRFARGAETPIGCTNNKSLIDNAHFVDNLKQQKGSKGYVAGAKGMGPIEPFRMQGLPPGAIMLPHLQEMLKVTATQKRQLGELQREFESKVKQILTDEQY